MGRVNKTTKAKYKKVIKDISSIDLTDLMKLSLKDSEKELKKQIIFW